MSDEKLAKLKLRLETEMDNLQQSPNLFKVLEEGFADKRLYGIYLTETRIRVKVKINLRV